jgi:hypothetical protein
VLTTTKKKCDEGLLWKLKWALRSSLGSSMSRDGGGRPENAARPKP